MYTYFNLNGREEHIIKNWHVGKALKGGLCYVAGGCIRSYFNDEYIADYDMFFVTKERAAQVEAELIHSGYWVLYKCPLGFLTTLTNENETKIQLITEKVYATAYDLISSFDFTITQFATDGKTLWTTHAALRDTRHMVLAVNKLEYPAASLGRIPKYVARGYKATSAFRQDFIRRVIEGGDIIDGFRTYID